MTGRAKLDCVLTSHYLKVAWCEREPALDSPLSNNYIFLDA